MKIIIIKFNQSESMAFIFNNNHLTTPLGKYSFLKFNLKLFYYIALSKYTKYFTFSSIIRHLPVCIVFQFLVSFDVVSPFTNIPLDETISIFADFFCIVVHLLLPFPFLRKFLLNWWVLPQNQCLFVLMRSCTARSTALVWVALLAPFWLIFSLGSKKDISLIGFLSPSFVTLRPLAPTHVNFLLTMSLLTPAGDQLVAEGVTHISLPLHKNTIGGTGENKTDEQTWTKLGVNQEQKEVCNTSFPCADYR